MSKPTPTPPTPEQIKKQAKEYGKVLGFCYCQTPNNTPSKNCIYCGGLK